jgi:hypothetical protein
MWFTHLIISQNPSTTASKVYGWMPLEALGLVDVWYEAVASKAEGPCVNIHI